MYDSFSSLACPHPLGAEKLLGVLLHTRLLYGKFRIQPEGKVTNNWREIMLGL
jgi:hypothetical protein